MRRPGQSVCRPGGRLVEAPRSARRRRRRRALSSASPLPPGGRVRRRRGRTAGRRAEPEAGAATVAGRGCVRRRGRRNERPRNRPAPGGRPRWCQRRGQVRRGWSPREIQRGRLLAARQRTRRAAAYARPPEARGSLSRERSGRQPVATLAPTGADDRATGTGAHPKTEPVRLGPSPVVRLEGPLAHRKTPSKGGKGTLAPPTHRRPFEPTVARPAGQTHPGSHQALHDAPTDDKESLVKATRRSMTTDYRLVVENRLMAARRHC